MKLYFEVNNELLSIEIFIINIKNIYYKYKLGYLIIEIL